MSAEQGESGEIERVGLALDIRFITDLTGIDEATRNHGEAQLVLRTVDLPDPVDEYRILVEGSSEELGRYFFRSELQLKQTGEPGLVSLETMQRFLAGKNAQVYDNSETGNSYVYVSNNYVYFVYEEPGCGISVVTCGEHDETLSLYAHVVHGLEHQVDDSAPAMIDFLQQQKELLAVLYAVSDVDPPPIRLLVAPSESLPVVANKPKALLSGIIEVSEISIPEFDMTGHEAQGLADLSGIEDIKERLKEIILIMKRPEIASRYLLSRPNGILFYGPPGTGKSTIAQALAIELSAEVKVIDGSQVYGGLMGDSEKGIAKIFDEAKKAKKPLVIMIEEIDGLIRPNGSSGYAAVAAIFKQRMESLSKENPNVIVVATSQKTPADIDEATFRDGRFECIQVSLPSQAEREGVFASLVAKYIIAGNTTFASHIDFTALAAVTDGMSRMNIKTILECTVRPLAIQEMRTGRKPDGQITTQDIMDAISSFRTSKS